MSQYILTDLVRTDGQKRVLKQVWVSADIANNYGDLVYDLEGVAWFLQGTHGQALDSSDPKVKPIVLTPEIQPEPADLGEVYEDADGAKKIRGAESDEFAGLVKAIVDLRAEFTEARQDVFRTKPA
jgi:hypothetical protein